MNGSEPAAPFEALLFDLDGTLVDSRRGIEASVRAALAATGIDVDVPALGGRLSLPLEALIASLGPALDATQRGRVAAAFARSYDATGWLASDLYPGVRDALADLHRAGARLFVVTNKRRTPTIAILSKHGLADMIEAVYTLDSATPSYPSKGAMAQACVMDHALRPWTTLVVGDSTDDRDMAQAAGAAFAAASWGYGDVLQPMPELDGQNGSNHPDASRRETVLVTITDLPAFIASRGGVEAHR